MNNAVSIRPGVGMLGLFPHMKYQPWYALGELVDNGIQSYLSNRDQLRDIEGHDYLLRIEIEIDPQQGGAIVVRDNAAGIARGDWHRAFLVAEPPADNSGLSQFGIGMKAACCWFAKNWSVRTTYMGEEVIRSVAFDIPEIVASRVETLQVVEEPTDWRTHFTEIRMTNLYRAPQRRTLSKIRDYLGGIYRQFLRNGDIEIVFNGKAITYSEPLGLSAPLWSNLDGDPITWRKDIDLRLDSGRRVTGFVAIRETGSTSLAGLALFYRQKVVMGAGEDAEEITAGEPSLAGALMGNSIAPRSPCLALMRRTSSRIAAAEGQRSLGALRVERSMSAMTSGFMCGARSPSERAGWVATSTINSCGFSAACTKSPETKANNVAPSA